MDAQIDHTTGLFMLRENNKPLNIHCTKMVYDDLTTGNPIFKILKHYCDVNWNEIDVSSENKAFTILNENLLFTPIPLKSKAPPYSPHRKDPHVGDNIGMLITDNSTKKSVFPYKMVSVNKKLHRKKNNKVLTVFMITLCT